MAPHADEIKEAPPYTDDPNVTDTQEAEVEDKFEVFKRGDGQVDFRTVSWIRASVIFLKSQSNSAPFTPFFLWQKLTLFNSHLRNRRPLHPITDVPARRIPWCHHCSRLEST
jgi:hypothetical protein